jgi:hypothetical protein
VPLALRQRALPWGPAPSPGQALRSAPHDR